jgi:hypothetical protein
MFTHAAAAAIPETVGRISSSGAELAIMSDVDESALRAFLATVPPPHSLPVRVCVCVCIRVCACACVWVETMRLRYAPPVSL